MSTDLSQNMTWFSKAVRAARGWLNWSTRELADRVGISLRQMQRIEVGESGSVQTRGKIEEVFQQAGVLLGPDGIKVVPPKGSVNGGRG